MRLETSYALGAIPVIRAFAAEAARFHGASEKEVFDLELAVEEAAVHIIENHPLPERDTFEIVCEPASDSDGAIRVLLGNKGLPVNVKELPEYDAENPEDSLDGLNLFLIEKLVDSFRFENRGMEGWRTVLEKRLSNFKTPENPERPEREAEDAKAAAKEKLDVVQAESADAYGITKLAYLTYKYTYSKNVFYHPEILTENLANGNIISFVVKNPGGEIVGHAAYTRSQYCYGIAEACALMINPKYRRTRAAIKVLNAQIAFPNDENSGIDIVEGNPVTSHTRSQRILRKLQSFQPTALRLSVHDHAEFVDIDDAQTEQRESLLYSVWVPRGIAPVTAYPPAEHADIVERIFKGIGVQALVRQESAEAENETGLNNIGKNENAGLATIRIDRLGLQWREKLKTLRKDISVEGYATIHLLVSMAEPLPKDMDAKLAQAGFFFSGIIPRTTGRWDILYTFLNNQDFDFERVAVVTDMAVELKKYVSEQYRKADI